MNAVMFFIVFFSLGIILAMLFSERKKLLKKMEAAEDDALEAELESSRKEFALHMLSAEHRQETDELKSELRRAERYNKELEAVIRFERKRAEDATA